MESTKADPVIIQKLAVFGVIQSRFWIVHFSTARAIFGENTMIYANKNKMGYIKRKRIAKQIVRTSIYIII